MLWHATVIMHISYVHKAEVFLLFDPFLVRTEQIVVKDNEKIRQNEAKM